MKKSAPFVATVLLLSLMAIGSVSVVYHTASRYLAAQDKAHPSVQSCRTILATHEVTIYHGRIAASHTQARLCDRLTITNEDERLRLIAFGQHNDHQPYDGVTEKVLSQNQSLTITLNQIGTYEFHDHLQDELVGYFTVSE